MDYPKNRVSSYSVTIETSFVEEKEVLFTSHHSSELDNWLEEHGADMTRSYGCMERPKNKKLFCILITGNYSDMFQGTMFYAMREGV